MIYGDSLVTRQEDYDWYYINKYGYGVSDLESNQRLKNRAGYIVEYAPKNAKIVDFGGGESGLPKYIDDLDFDDLMTVYNVGCGDEMPVNVDVIVAEHVLEHIYDLQTAMRSIKNSLKENGMFIVDVPDAGAASFEQPEQMPILDYTQVHINHFRMLDMLRLASNYGFELVETNLYHERYGACRMYVFMNNGNIVAKNSREVVTKNIAKKVDKLRLIDKPVCVWGCGDIALQCLSEHWPDVKYFIDNDPAYKDAVINGVPVYEKPIDDLPILVIAQTQKKQLLERIARECTNEVIEI